MSEKNLQARIINKNDTEANWNKAVNFIPKQGEIIIYNKDDNHDYVRFKIGDGLTAVIDLPFYQELPIVTTDDNDKILMVSNGEWIATTITNAEGVAY